MKKKIKRGRLFLRRLNRFISTTIIGGLVVVLPLALLVVLIRFLVQFFGQLVNPIISLLGLETYIPHWAALFITFLIILLAFFFIGLIIRTRFGSRLFAIIETNWLKKLPFYNTLRETVQSFFGTKNTPFKQVVLVDVYGTNTLMTGFITAELGNDLYTVFAPTGPNPTNGFIFHVTKEQLTFLDVKPEDAMRTIIGVGVGSDILFKTNDN